MVVDGVDSETSIKNKTQAFQSWFFRIEFIDCIMVITKDSFLFFGAAEKVKFFGQLEELFKKANKKLIMVEKSKGEIRLPISKLIS